MREGKKRIGMGWLVAWLVAAAAPLQGQERRVDFHREIQPLFTEHCAECHGGVKRRGDLSLTNRVDAFEEAKSGRRPVVPGDPGRSELVARVTTADEEERMPPHGALGEEEMELLRRWVAEGASWPEHWSLMPLEGGDLPVVQGTGWWRNEVDRFVQGVLEEEGLEPSPEASPETLARRLSLDLVGLLPEAGRVERFARSYREGSPAEREELYQDLVEENLGNPAFGERWGRHWLDEARYADSTGYEKDSARADAFRYRDWVIRAVNADMPFDEFTVRQIAGDLLPGAGEEERVATMFQLMTQFNLEGGVDAEEDRTKRVMDQVNTVGTVWMGASVECMMCHDHPYDSMTQREFYQLYAFFNNADFEAILPGETVETREEKLAKRAERWLPLAQMLEEQVTNKSLATRVQSGLTQMQNYDNEHGFTRVVAERRENRRATYVFDRGNFQQPLTGAGEVKPGTPAVLPALRVRGGEGDRLDLARWLVGAEHPLTARVVANKVWMQLMGAPLVPSPQDFGMSGQAPRHPELLDWLAGYYRGEAGWSRKALIRKIVGSATYRQGSAHRPELVERDPQNELWGRQNRFRVQGETLRDISLQGAGLLSRKVGGPSVFPPLPEDVAALSYANNFRWKTSPGEDRYRRGLYTFFKRTAPDPNLVTFDCPEATVTSQMRAVSNTPLQALVTLQNEVYHEAAQAFAARLLRLADRDDEGRLEEGYRIALGREAQKEEVAALLGLLGEARAYYRVATAEAGELAGAGAAGGPPVEEAAAWVATVRIILNLDEFLTRA